jgi:carboxymethylenebutenolidase
MIDRTRLFRYVGPIALCTLVACGGTGDVEREYADSMAREHRDDAPVSNPASESAPTAPVSDGPVDYATVDGERVTGFLARPADQTGPAPGLIVIHEWWGLNDNIRSMAKRLAGEGYVALAVDLYGGQVAEDSDTAYDLMMAANQNPKRAEENLRQAHDYLSGELSAPLVASIGWCFGGSWSLNTALLIPDKLDAAVIYYGQLTTDRDRLATLDMPILGIFGELDQGIPVEGVRQFDSVMDDLDKNARIVIYPDADHAFANPSGRNYQPEAAEEAWQQTVEFLRAYLTTEG